MNSRLCSRPTHLIKFNNIELNILRTYGNIYSSEYFDQLCVEKLEVYMLKFFKVSLEDELYNTELSIFLHSYLEAFYLENQLFYQPFISILPTLYTTTYIYSSYSLHSYQQTIPQQPNMSTISLKYTYTRKPQFKLTQ